MGRRTHRSAPGALTTLVAAAGLLTASGCNGAVDGAAGSKGPASAADFVPAEPVLQRLTTAQYTNALRDLFGDPLPALSLEPDTQPHLFSTIGAATTTVSENGVAMWEQAAVDVATTVFGDAARRAVLVGCEPATVADACSADFLRRFGRRAFRRPLTEDEWTRYLDVARRAGAGDPWTGVRYAVAALLQSPSFLYRVELGEADPDDPTRLRYTSLEMASRISFFLWNTIPDEALLDAGEAGELVTEAGVRSAVARLLADDARTRAAFRPFFREYLALSRLDTLQRDPVLFPEMTPALGAAMREEIERLVDRLVFDDRAPFPELFTTRETMVNGDLGRLYGVAEAASLDASTWIPFEHAAEGARAGLLTTAGVLALAAHADRTSPTRRGQFVRERLLCEFVPPPPADFPLEINPDKVPENAPLREKLKAHRENPACAGCHASTDPIGLGIEDFDAIGRHRSMEGEHPVDASGELDGTTFEGGRELGEVLAADPRTVTCVVKQLYRQASGRLETEGERSVLGDIEAGFRARGLEVTAALEEIAASAGFRYLRPAARADAEEVSP